MTRIYQLTFDDDDELNDRLDNLKKELVLEYGMINGKPRGSLRVINIFPRGEPNAPGRKILPIYEAWVEVQGDV